MTDEYRSADRRDMLPFLPARRSTVLEIGCGEGRFAASIPGTTEAWGVEPDERAAALADGRLFRVIHATFDEAQGSLPRHYFDIIVCNDVIEHMIDHDGFFEGAKELLSPGGTLVASIPNVRYYQNLFNLIVCRDWEYLESGILDRTHLRFFTERSLRRTLEQHGYRIEELRGIHGGIALNWTKWGISYFLFAWMLITLSLGRFRDVEFVQFAVRASVLDRPSAS